MGSNPWNFAETSYLDTDTSVEVWISMNHREKMKANLIRLIPRKPRSLDGKILLIKTQQQSRFQVSRKESKRENHGAVCSRHAPGFESPLSTTCRRWSAAVLCKTGDAKTQEHLPKKKRNNVASDRLSQIHSQPKSFRSHGDQDSVIVVAHTSRFEPIVEWPDTWRRQQACQHLSKITCLRRVCAFSFSCSPSFSTFSTASA